MTMYANDTLRLIVIRKRVRLFLAGLRAALRLGNRTLFIPQDEDAFVRTVVSLLGTNEFAHKYGIHIARGQKDGLPQIFREELVVAETLQLLVRREGSTMFCPSLTPAIFSECRKNSYVPFREAHAFAERYLKETHKFTSDQERRFVRARREWERKLQPLMDGYAAASRITEEDLRITITSPPIRDEQ